jgi:hypothetical protein
MVVATRLRTLQCKAQTTMTPPRSVGWKQRADGTDLEIVTSSKTAATGAVRSFAIVGSVQPPLDASPSSSSMCSGARVRGSTDRAQAGLVISFVDPEHPRPFRRRSRGTFVAALWNRPELPLDVEAGGDLSMLVRALANISSATSGGVSCARDGARLLPCSRGEWGLVPRCSHDSDHSRRLGS